jgi:hypothetical protein
MNHTRSKVKGGTRLRDLALAFQADVRRWAEQDVASLLLAGLAILFALLTVVSMAVIDWKGYSILPWGDMWDYWAWYLKYKDHLFTALWLQHNEHRIAVARLFFLVDQNLFHARAVFILVCIFLIQFFHALLLAWLARLANWRCKTGSVFLGAAAFLCLFSAQQYTNFTWSFQIQFVAVYFAVTAALTSVMVLARSSSQGAAWVATRRHLWMAAAIVFGIIATYSMANGLLIWPLLVVVAYWYDLPRRDKAVLVVTGAIMWALYLGGYKTPPQHSSIREGILKLPRSIHPSARGFSNSLKALPTRCVCWGLLWTPSSQPYSTHFPLAAKTGDWPGMQRRD